MTGRDAAPSAGPEHPPAETTALPDRELGSGERRPALRRRIAAAAALVAFALALAVAVAVLARPLLVLPLVVLSLAAAGLASWNALIPGAGAEGSRPWWRLWP